MKVIDKDTIKNNEKFILKWANDVERQNGDYNPSWKNPGQADSFFVHIDNQTSIINQARFIIMDAKEYDISYLRVKARLQYMAKRSGENKGKQLTSDYTTDITEAVPEFTKSTLSAVPFSAFTWTPKTFLLLNIEKANFLPMMETLLAERCGYSAEQIGMYGIKKDTPTTQDGMEYVDGIFKQVRAVRNAYDAAKALDPTKVKQSPMGYYNDININQAIIPQMKKMLTQYSIQKGNRSRAKFFVSNLIYGLLVEEADGRETARGDVLFFDGGQLRIWNTPIEVADFMDVPENGYGEQIMLADPDSIVFGFLDEITSENSYEHPQKSYLSSVDIFFDVLLLWNKDVLVAEVKSTPAPVEGDLTVNVSSGTTAIETATVTVKNADGLTKSASTNSSGEAEFEDLDNGDYTIEVTKSGYADYKGAITIKGDVEVDVNLTPTRTVSFTVNDGTDPIQSATLVIDGDTEGAKTTGSSGGCTATLTDGQHTIVISKSSYETKTELITVSESATSFTVSLTASGG